MTTGPEAVVACILCAGIAAVFVALRLYTRFFISRHPGWDDGLVVVALVFSIVLCPIYYKQLQFGLGDHLRDIPPPKLVKQMRWFWASTWIYLTGVAFAKISILMQYVRVFVGRKTIISSWATIGFIITCCLVCLFGGIFACTPIKKFWDPTVPGTCIHYFVIWYLHCAMSISTDLAIIIIPLPTIFHMNLERKKKWSLAFTFALGGFGCITSIIRLYYLYFLSGSSDSTHYNPITALWSTVELNVVIVCACLITLHPLLVRLLSPIKRFASNYSQQRSTPPSYRLDNHAYPNAHAHSNGHGNGGRSSRSTSVWGAGGKASPASGGGGGGGVGWGTTLLDDSSEERLAPEAGPDGGIKVETTIDMSVDVADGAFSAADQRSVGTSWGGQTLSRGRSDGSLKGGSSIGGGERWKGDTEVFRMV